ncbi:hypothetical protein BDZ90DRAFT_229679 [Jaminaea rosea]|uniref:RING-type domain-containing protein n=1 Tax=Jaminaea rosea TaxID=1569628 RepID=A0A316V3A7_9BASI|nr:hypothetical protein BDZ90DRAFT_229679 [Jaminaea rosea]PWN30673.1 hypothetical protein BDZ90DRAFT_229679 [Jaminaea rosea]
MKFAKTYLATLTDPNFPQEWREKGLEYKELKKLINGAVAELESLGLSADVLRDLLEPPEEQAQAAARSSSPVQQQQQRRSRSRSDSASASESGDDSLTAGLVAGLAKLSTGRQGPSDFVDPLSPLMEEEEARRKSAEHSMKVPAMSMPAPAVDIEEESTPAGEWVSHLEHTRDRRRPRSSRGKSGSSGGESSRESSAPLPEKGKGSNGHHHHTHLLDPSSAEEPAAASPMSLLGIRKRRESDNERHSSNPVTGSSDRDSSPGASWRMGRKDLEMLRRHSHSGNSSGNKVTPPRDNKTSLSPEAEDERHDWGGHAWRERTGLGWEVKGKSKSMHAAQASPTIARGPGQARWVQGKDGRRARAEYELGGTTEHPIPRIRLTIESPVNSDSESDADDEGGASDEDDKVSEMGIADRIKELPPSQPGSRRASLADDPAPHQHAPHPTPPPSVMRTREIIIPLTADTQFLDTLTNSLAQLSELQASQREEFITSTEDLCASVARAASPYASKNDLYVWREIFQLWVDMQIFEGQTEKTRGELSVDESEARLKRFAQELVKRGWLAQSSVGGESPRLSRNKKAVQNALTLPIRDSRSTNAVEDFLRLNLALLDVKKFQRVNVEAARKILKKHDKRTALTASSGLREFVRQQESTRAAASAAAAASLGMHLPAEMTGTLVAPAHGTHPSLAALLPSSTTGLLSESLPHILLTLLTTTLLPILPSVDDYSCAICTGLAWRPIRLDCSHLFCIRCLVKLQKQGKTDCPLCRAPGVVKTADGRNLDAATVNMLKMWFPNEISEKDHENERDRKKEELAEFGLEHHKCVCM